MTSRNLLPARSTTAGFPARPSRSDGHGAQRPEISISRGARWAFGLALFFSVSRLHLSFGPLAALRPPFVFSLLATALLLGQTTAWKPQRLLRHWIWKGIAVIVVFAVLGVPFSIYPGRSLSFILAAFSRAIWAGILTYAVAGSARGTTFLARTLAIAGVATCFLALLVNERDVDGRLAGAYTYDPNDLALVACMTLPLVVWYCMERNHRLRWFMALTIPVLLLALIDSGSRGGFLGLAAMVVGTVMLGLRSAGKRLRRLSIAVLVLGAVSIPLAPADYRQRILTIWESDADYNFTSESGRIAVWKRGWGYATSHPVFGVGIDNFTTAEGRLSSLARDREVAGRGMKWSVAHNSYLQVLSELGFVAGAAFLLLIVGSIVELTVSEARQPRVRGLAAGTLGPLLGISILGYAVTGIFLSFAYYDAIYVALAMSAAILVRRGSRGRRRGPFARLGHAIDARTSPVSHS